MLSSTSHSYYNVYPKQNLGQTQERLKQQLNHSSLGYSVDPFVLHTLIYLTISEDYIETLPKSWGGVAVFNFFL